MERCMNCPNKRGECVGYNIECNVTREELKMQIAETLKMLYIKQLDLIQREANEVCIAAYFWFYFNELYGELYSNMNIDMEYNKCGADPKRYYILTGEEKNKAIPDMIIHKRLCNKNNFLFLEFKKNKTNIDGDYRKLKVFTKQKYEGCNIKPKYRYKYCHGISVILGKRNTILTWFEDGERKEEDMIDVRGI